MKCAFCGGSEKAATTEYIEKQGNYIIVIKNVPCMKCEQCGEVFFQPMWLRRLRGSLTLFR